MSMEEDTAHEVILRELKAEGKSQIIKRYRSK
jgi:hypothetical protein